jgi:alkanesulfonate monooxygenase
MSEIAWFSALCDDDYEFLGQPDPRLQSSFEHCRNIVLTAEQGGLDNILLPSGYALGLDTLAFAAGMAPLTTRIKLLAAIRCGEMWPPQQARQLATLDRMLNGRLSINIISSDMPGEQLDSESIDFQGTYYKLKLDPPRLRTLSGRAPLLYFGGLSPAARAVAAQQADVYLMWPDTLPAVRDIIADMRARAAAHHRTLRFGYRVHVVVRETEAEARAAATRLLSRLDDAEGARIRQRSLDAGSLGVGRQAELRQSAGADGYVEENLWTGIGRARSGCGAAIVGNPDQVLAKLRAYEAEGMQAFILSGYPHAAECDLFARHVLPNLNHAALT